jgi:threonine dehydrogenase-like Zn-dependent dehydrogenase
MRALMRAKGRLCIQDVAAPQLGSAEDVKISVTTAGLCRTDVYVAQGKIAVAEPLILGHEFAGLVMEAAAATGFHAGDAVTVVPLINCGVCHGCMTGRACLDQKFLGLHANGAFADEVVVPARNVRRVPEWLDPRRAAYSEPVAAALAPLNVDLPRDGYGLVLGNGRIADLTHRILVRHGFVNTKVLSVDEAAGLKGQFDFAIETEATEKAFRVLLEALRFGGTAVLKSRPARPVPLDVALAVKKDISLRAVSYGSFDDAIALLADMSWDIDDLLGDSFGLGQFENAMSAYEASGAVKTFFDLRMA